MKQSIQLIVLIAILSSMPFSVAYAGEAAIPNSFQSGQTALSSEVNANFAAVKTAVDDNDRRVAELESAVETLLSTIAALQDRIVALEESDVMALEDYVSMADDERGPLFRISGINLQIVNGLGITGSINGLGNLIVGYDEESLLTTNYCSDGSYDNQSDCETNGEIWDSSFKAGSHYLVLGSQNSYSRYGGLVAGHQCYSTGNFSTITGGFRNFSSGLYSSVSGGSGNHADGSGSSVSGGISNTAEAIYSSISGGVLNVASGNESSISGGYGNTASGDYSSVSGGENREASDSYDWAAGSQYEDD